MNHWVEFYEQVFGMTNIVHFGDDQIQTEYSALMSKVMADGAGQDQVPDQRAGRGEAQEPDRRVPRVQRGARACSTSRSSRGASSRTIEALKDRGVLFLDTPEAYYDEVEGRVGEIEEDYDDLKRLRILADRDEDGYLLQIFTKTAQDRPTLFFEVIERHGATTFGEGNFKALFESIEREQALRGNL